MPEGLPDMKAYVARARLARVLGLSAVIAATSYAWADDGISLFKVVTERDEIVIGLTTEQLHQLGGDDAGAVAAALAGRGRLTVWQYAVRKGTNGELQQAPLQRIGILAHDSLRIEPYATDLLVLAPEAL
jgi:hypothetical protein